MTLKKKMCAVYYFKLEPRWGIPIITHLCWFLGGLIVLSSLPSLIGYNVGVSLGVMYVGLYFMIFFKDKSKVLLG